MYNPVVVNPTLSRNQSTDRGDIIIQTVKNTSYGTAHRSSFAVSLTEFKSQLKTHLFRGAY